MSNPETIIHHSNCFKLLAACFYEPERTIFLEEQVTDNLGKLLDSIVPEIGTSASGLKEAFEQCSEEQLKVDYAALFVGPFELLAAPYGSVYLEDGGRVFGESTIDVQHFYETAGLSLDIQEPADHIAIELEFMHYLKVREAEAIASGRQEEARKMQAMQSQFLNRFMSWVPEFCERIEHGALTEYYTLLGQCLAAFYRYCKTELLTEAVEH